MNYLLLGQVDKALEGADKGVDTLTKLAQAGPTVMALAVAVIATVFAIWMLRKNWALQTRHEAALKEAAVKAAAEADERLVGVLKAANDRRNDEKQLMREMVGFGADSTEAVKESAKAMGLNTRALDSMIRMTEQLQRDIAEIKRGNA